LHFNSISIFFYFVGGIFPHHERKNLLLQLFVAGSAALAAVDENIVAPRVRVQITVESDAAVLAESPQQNFGVPHRRIRFPNHRPVLSVQISAGQRAPVVAHDHAVRVEHWDQFENKFCPQLLRKNLNFATYFAELVIFYLGWG
jgi:hypothetical protein